MADTSLDDPPAAEISIPLEDLQAVFDIAVGSMNFSSGFLDTEEVDTLRRIATLLGVDPMMGTPSEFKNQYRHQFDPYINHDTGITYKMCRWCSQPADASVHREVETTATAPTYSGSSGYDEATAQWTLRCTEHGVVYSNADNIGHHAAWVAHCAAAHGKGGDRD